MLANNRNEHVNADGNPNLGLHGIVRGAEKPFDAQMLFDPFEEEFDLPSEAIEIADGQGRQRHVIG